MPNPAPFQRALELIHLEPPDAIFVGDDAEWDVIGAKNAGRCVQCFSDRLPHR